MNTYNKNDKIEYTFSQADGTLVTHEGTVVSLRGSCLIYQLTSTTDKSFRKSPVGLNFNFDTKGQPSIVIEPAKKLSKRSTTIDRVQARKEGTIMSSKELAEEV